MIKNPAYRLIFLSFSSLSQSQHQGNGYYYTVVGCWFIRSSYHDTAKLQERKFPTSYNARPSSQQLQVCRNVFSSALNTDHTSRSANPNPPRVPATTSTITNLVSLLVLWFFSSKTSHGTMNNSTFQPCSWAAKSGKFTSLSIKTIQIKYSSVKHANGKIH